MAYRKTENGPIPGQTPITITNSSFKYAMIVSMTSTLLGLDIGISNLGTIHMSNTNVSDTKIMTYLIILTVLNVMASLAAGKASDLIGRRYTLLFPLIVHFFGSVASFAPNFGLFIFSQVLVAISSGFIHTVSPVYITELSPLSTRGFLTCFLEIFMNIGQIFGNIIANSMFNLPQHLVWRVFSAITTILSFILAFGVLSLPESPCWLALRGQVGDAKRVLSQISNSQHDLDLRLRSIKSVAGIPENCTNDVVPVPEQRSKHRTWKDLLLRPSPPVRKALIVAVGINFFQKSVGIEAVQLYSSRVLGINKYRDLLLATTAVGLINTGLSLLAGFLMDRIGRRPLLLASVAGLIPSLAGLGSTLTVTNQTNQKPLWARAFSMITLLSANSFFSIGLGPMTWAYSAELFPLKLRAQGASIASAVNWATRRATSLTFLSVYRESTIGGCFLVFAGIASVGLLFIIMVVPETGGKYLEEMELFGCEVCEGGIEIYCIRDEDIVGDSKDMRRLEKSATFPVFGPSTDTKQRIINVYV